MRITHFKLLKVIGKGPLDWIAVAQVRVKTGILWWSKTTTREITCSYAGGWCFTDTEHYTPSNTIAVLVRMQEAFTRQEIWKMVPVPTEKGE